MDYFQDIADMPGTNRLNNFATGGDDLGDDKKDENENTLKKRTVGV